MMQIFNIKLGNIPNVQNDQLMTTKKLYILFTFWGDLIYLCRCKIKFTTNVRLDGEILSLNV